MAELNGDLSAQLQQAGDDSLQAEQSNLSPMTPEPVRARSTSAFPSIPSSLSQFVSGSKSRTPAHIPDGVAPQTNGHPQTTTTTQDVAISTGGLMNRNKKKGFLKDMSAMQRTKTIFGPNECIALDTAPDPGMGQVGDISMNSMGTFEPDYESTPNNKVKGGRQAKRAQWTRVIPPSEIDDLPSNVFVSSAEFTAPRTDYRRNRKSAATREEEGSAAAEDAEEEEQEEEDLEAVRNDVMATESAGLTQSVAEHGQNLEMTPKELAWAKVEIAFEALDNVSVTKTPPCSVGTTVAWKVCRLAASQLQ